MMRKLFLVKLLLFTVLIVGLVAPGVKAVQAQGKVLHVANAEPTAGLDPAISATSASVRVWELMFDPLWDRDANFKAIPWLASKWDMAEGGKTWTFTLRDGIKFSDGSPITAEDVKFSFNRLAANAIQKSNLSVISSIDVVDPKTVKFTLKNQLPNFLDLPGSTVQFSIFSEKAMMGKTSDDFSKPGMVVSGPYMLDSYIPRDHLVLVKNPNYWNADAAKIDRIEWAFTEDPTAGVLAVQSGSADIYSPLPAKEVPRLKTTEGVKVYATTIPASYIGFGFDRTRAPFNDVKVRQAIALSIDSDQVGQVCWFGTSPVLYGGFIFPGAPAYQDIADFKAARADRLTKAAALLDAAGWVKGSDGMRVSKGVKGMTDGTPFSVKVDYESNWTAAECHTQLLQTFGKDIGLDLQPNRYDPAAFWGDAIAGKHQMWHAGIPAGLTTIQMLQSSFTTDGTWAAYWIKQDDKSISDAINAAALETDSAKQMADVQAINKQLIDQQAGISDLSQSTLVVATSKLTGFFARPDDSSRAIIVSDLSA